MPVTVPRPEEVPVVPVPTAGRWLGMGRSKAYVEARRYLNTGGREGLPAIELGHRLVTPVAKVRALLGLDTKEVA